MLSGCLPIFGKHFGFTPSRNAQFPFRAVANRRGLLVPAEVQIETVRSHLMRTHAPRCRRTFQNGKPSEK